jgi:hypothetical protein
MNTSTGKSSKEKKQQQQQHQQRLHRQKLYTYTLNTYTIVRGFRVLTKFFKRFHISISESTMWEIIRGL